MAVKNDLADKTPKDKRKIKVCMNGPYLVSGGIPLVEQIISRDAEGYSQEWRTGNRYSSKENYRLCRCGRSENRPFCDDTHINVNFDGAETASRESYLDQAEEIGGQALRLTDAQDLCASAGFCTRADGIWNLTKRSSDPEARRVAIEEAGNCPSGRLVIWDKRSGEAIEPEFEESVGLVEDPDVGESGPIWVRGGIPVESADGGNYEVRNRVTLCRCGKSSNKPFCDGSHV